MADKQFVESVAKFVRGSADKKEKFLADLHQGQLYWQHFSALVDAQRWDLIDALAAALDVEILGFMRMLIPINASGRQFAPRRSHLLHLISSSNGAVAVVRSLLSRGVSSTLTNADGETSMHVAIRHGADEILTTFATCSPDALNVCTNAGSSLVHYCASYNRPKALEILLRSDRCYPVGFDMHGNSPLHTSALVGSRECLDLLLRDQRFDSYLHFQNNQGQSLVHLLEKQDLAKFPSLLQSSQKSDLDEPKFQIQIVSDLHLEFYSARGVDFSELIQPACPYVALLGDITVIEKTMKIFDEFLKYISPKFKKIFVLAGNHEYYFSSSLHASTSKLREYCSTHTNVLFMDRDEYVDGNTVVLGATLWSKCPSEFVGQVERYLADYHRIYVDEASGKLLKVQDTNELHQISVEWLKDRIDHYSACGKKIVVLTHHSPLINISCSDPEFFFSPTNHGFCTDLRSLLRPSVKAWCYGHTHYFQNSVIENTRVISNPAGYPPVLKSYNPRFVLDV